MARFNARTAAAATAARVAAVAPRRAPARAATTVSAPRFVVVSIDGGPFVATPFVMSDFHDAGTFALDVVASLAWAATGHTVTGLREVGGKAGAYAGTLNAGRNRIAFAFKSAPAAAPASVSAEKPAPVAAPAPAAPAKSLPAPAVAAEMKAGSAIARAARTPAHVHVILQGCGGFALDCTEADLANPAAFVREHVAHRVAAYHGWPRCGVDYASRAGVNTFHGAVSHGRARQIVDITIVPPTATLGYVLPARAGQGFAPRAAAPSAIDLGARMGLTPAGHHVAAAEAKAKAAGVKLSRQDRTAAEAQDAAATRAVTPGRTASGHAVEAAPRMSAANLAIFEAAQKGTLPAAPDFSAETHTRYRGKLAELVALVAKGDVAALRSYHINPISTSPKALDRYRNAAVVALEVRAAARAAKAA